MTNRIKLLMGSILTIAALSIGSDSYALSAKSNPKAYDVICFQARGMMVNRTMCDPSRTYKIYKGTGVNVYLDKQTSVQQGTNTVVSFKYKNKNNSNLQKITISEMELLASKGANIYAMAYHLVSSFGGSQPFVEVEIFNNNLGNFKMFDQDLTKVTFVTGDTKVRVVKPPRRTGLLGDMDAVKNGGVYTKIFHKKP